MTAFCLSTNPFLLMLLCYSIDDMTKVWFAESVCLTSYTSAAKKIGLYMALNFPAHNQHCVISSKTIRLQGVHNKARLLSWVVCRLCVCEFLSSLLSIAHSKVMHCCNHITFSHYSTEFSNYIIITIRLLLLLQRFFNNLHDRKTE